MGDILRVTSNQIIDCDYMNRINSTSSKPRTARKLLKSDLNSVADIQMSEIDLTKLVKSFTERRREADPRAREVLDEFIRVAEALPAESKMGPEIVALEQSWRETLSDSQVIDCLRALYPKRASGRRRNHR
jgi:hypothetical protein